MSQTIRYTISARGKKENLPIDVFLNQFFPSIPLNSIDSIFGFVEPTSLYSGRPYLNRQISDNDYEILQAKNIGMRLPFTNHYCSLKEYEKNKPLFEKYHKKGNSVICTNEDLAKWIRKDYPLYQLEASILQELNSLDKINKALDLYNTAVLPMELNKKLDFLEKLPQKDRITLFGNAGCALTCPNRICYEYLSRKNKKLTKQSLIMRYIYFFYHIGIKNDWCMHRVKPRNLRGVIDFDLQPFIDMGFSRFKMLRENKDRKSGY